MKKTINWKKVWTDFSIWHSSPKPISTCKLCNHPEYPYLGLGDQQVKIQQLVNAQVREIMEKKI